MILDIILIITRALDGLISATFIVSTFLYRKNPIKYQICEKISMHTGAIILAYGLITLIAYAVIGH